MSVLFGQQNTGADRLNRRFSSSRLYCNGLNTTTNDILTAFNNPEMLICECCVCNVAKL